MSRGWGLADWRPGVPGWVAFEPAHPTPIVSVSPAVTAMVALASPPLPPAVFPPEPPWAPNTSKVIEETPAGTVKELPGQVNDVDVA